MRRLPVLSLFAAVLLSGVAMTTTSCAEAGKSASAASDEAFGKRVRAYLLSHPEVIAEVIQAYKAKQETQAADNSRQAIVTNKARLEHQAGDPSLGDGPITVVEFFDYRCTYCKAAAPAMPGMVADNKSIRLVFKEFPILTEVSEHAARAALAAQKQGRYMPVHLAFMAEKALDDAAIDRILAEKGVNLDQAHTDMKSAEISAQLDANHALAREIGVDGTPGFIVGDKLIPGYNKDEILSSVKALAATGAKPAPAKTTTATKPGI
jgi:protein-disulfide isomerase